jgi:outer membrane protein TolC
MIFLLAGPPFAVLRAEQPERISPDRAAAMAKENSRELELGKLQQEADIRAYQLSLRQFFPSLSLSLTGSDAVTIGKPDTRVKRFSITVTQPIVSGGKRAAERSSTRHRLELNRRSLEDREHELADSAWALFHRILLLEQTLSLRKQGLDLARAEQKVMTASHRLGEITDLDLIETELTVNELEWETAETKARLEKALFSMKKLLGIDPAIPLIFEGSLDPGYAGIEIRNGPDFYYRLALENNYGIASKRAAVQEKQEAYRISKRSWLPSIDIEGSFFIQGEEYPLQEPGFTITVSLSAPAPLVPVRTRISGGSEGTGEVNRGFGIDATVADSITWYPDMKKNALAAAAARLELEQARADLEFHIGEAIAEYRRKKDQADIAGRRLALQRRRMAVLEEKLKLGEIRRPDFIKDSIETAESEIGLLEIVLGLIEGERNIEKLAGLPPGELRVYESSGISGGDVKGVEK